MARKPLKPPHILPAMVVGGVVTAIVLVVGWVGYNIVTDIQAMKYLAVLLGVLAVFYLVGWALFAATGDYPGEK